MKYVASYDLNSPGKDYKSLTDALLSLGGERVLYSQWAVRSSGTAAQVRDYLWQFMDRNDRLLVMAVDSGDWASQNAMIDLNKVRAA